MAGELTGRATEPGATSLGQTDRTSNLCIAPLPSSITSAPMQPNSHKHTFASLLAPRSSHLPCLPARPASRVHPISSPSLRLPSLPRSTKQVESREHLTALLDSAAALHVLACCLRISNRCVVGGAVLSTSYRV